MWATIRKRLRPPRFSLRTLLVVVVLLSVYLGYQTRQAHRQQRAVAAIEALGGTAWYDFQCDDDGRCAVGPFYPLPERPVAVRWFGSDMTSTVVNVQLNGCEFSDVDLSLLADLRGVKVLNLMYTNVNDDGLDHLYSLRSLRFVDLQDTHVTDAAVASLQSALPQLDIHHKGEFERLIKLIEETIEPTSGPWSGTAEGNDEIAPGQNELNLIIQ